MMRNDFLAALLAAAVTVAGCGTATSTGDGPGPAGAPTDAPPVSGAPAPGGGLTVGEALASEVDGPITVRGFLIAEGEQVRLCEVVAESYPPQCGDPSLQVRGVDVAAMEGAQQEGEIAWVDRVSLTGELQKGVLEVSDTTV